MVPFTVVGAIAGTVATLLFVGSALPMLLRAHRTRDLSSYSPANLIIANAGNLAQTLYVVTLPPGPVWAMHTFNVIVSALMLLWWLRHHWLPTRRLPHPDNSQQTVNQQTVNQQTVNQQTVHSEEEPHHDYLDHRSDRNRRPHPGQLPERRRRAGAGVGPRP